MVDKPDNMNTPTEDFSELEDEIKGYFDSSASVPSQMDLTRIKARAESIPSSASPIPYWLRPALVASTCALATFIFFQQNFHSDGLLKDHTPATRTAGTATALMADAHTSQGLVPSDAKDPWISEDSEPYLEFGWEDDFDVDLFHGVYDQSETALILATYESL